MDNINFRIIKVQTEKTFVENGFECKLTFITQNDDPEYLQWVKITNESTIVFDSTGGTARVVNDILNKIFKNQKDN